MSKNTVLAAVAAALVVLPCLAFAQEPGRCGDVGAATLRTCLQPGRPDLRACLRQCRSVQGGACPDGVDIDDCVEGAAFQQCAATCRDVRRKQIRACVQESTDSSGRCRTVPLPTATPTPH